MPETTTLESEAKRHVERVWLWYTPVWGAVAGLTMLTGLAERWGDVALLAFGSTLGLAAVLLPIWLRPTSDRHGPWHQSIAAKLSASVVAFAVLLNYSQTPFFFDVLHMHYGFRSTVNIQHNPVFLYLLTIAYFATYCALSLFCVRTVRARGWPQPLRLGALALIPFALAFLETLLNANPFTTRLFCYDDASFALGFGTLAYGLAFVFAIPVWVAIGEKRDSDSSPSLGRVLLYSCAAVYLDSLALDAITHGIAPHFTEVTVGAKGLGASPDNCLGRGSSDG